MVSTQTHGLSGALLVLLANGVVVLGCGSAEEKPTTPKIHEDPDSGVGDTPDSSSLPVDAGGGTPNPGNELVIGQPRTAFINALEDGPPAIRMCFTRYPNTRPLPYDRLVPLGNRVGLGAGAATAYRSIEAAARADLSAAFVELPVKFEVALIDAGQLALGGLGDASCANALAAISASGVGDAPRRVMLEPEAFTGEPGLQIIAFRGSWKNNTAAVSVLRHSQSYLRGTTDQFSLQVANLSTLFTAMSPAVTAKNIELVATGMWPQLGHFAPAQLGLVPADVTEGVRVQWTPAGSQAPIGVSLLNAQSYLDPHLAASDFFIPRSNVILVFVGNHPIDEVSNAPSSARLHLIAIPAVAAEAEMEAPAGFVTTGPHNFPKPDTD